MEDEHVVDDAAVAVTLAEHVPRHGSTSGTWTEETVHVALWGEGGTAEHGDWHGERLPRAIEHVDRLA